jgi:hypothetical protein
MVSFMRFVPIVGIIVGINQTASAQFVMRSVPNGFQNYSLYTRSFGYFAPSPTGGYGFQMRYTSYRTYNNIVVAPVAPLNALVANSGLYAAASGAGRPLNDRQQFALQLAQRARPADVGAKQEAFDRVVAPPMPIAADKANGVANAALAVPNEADLLSGVALNRLLTAIQTLEANGVKANAPFLPPELLACTTFLGNENADAINIFSEDKLAFPATLQGTFIDPLRSAIDKDFETIVTQLRTGKKGLDAAALDRIAENAKKLNALQPGAISEECGCPLLPKLESAAKALKQNPNVLVSNWWSVGVGVGELTKHLTKHKLEFGHARPSDDGAYASLHRAMATYLAELLAAKK